MVKAKKYVYTKHFEGLPKVTDLPIVEEELPPIKNGEFLTEAVFLSVDPYMRAMSYKLPLGSTFMGSQVAKIIESKNPKFPVGKYVVGEFGWRTHTISDGQRPSNGFPAPWIIPDFEGLPLSLALGVLGMPGNTSYFGFLEICNPKPGDTVVVSGAAGAVGSHVGQIAKIKGCTVIGIAGSDEKGKWLVDELKFDHFLNYNDKDFVEKLAKVVPNGVDCYFDNVGGEISSQVLHKMNMYGRVSCCGAISHYNDEVKCDAVQFDMVFKQLKMHGWIVFEWIDRWFEGINQNKKWVKEGKLVYRETVTEGFENMFEAFIGLMKGSNTGKAIIKV